MKFYEVNEGILINCESIMSVDRNKEGTMIFTNSKFGSYITNKSYEKVIQDLRWLNIEIQRF